MDNTSMPTVNQDYYRIEKAILFLEQNFRERPDLRTIARSVNLSQHHFHRLFRRWAGISPKRFLQYLTLDYAKGLLQDSGNLLDATYEAGLSSPGRLHDLFVTIEAVTPGEFKNGGAGVAIDYGFHPSPFGECFLAATERGICGLGFVMAGGRARALADFRKRWKEARFVENLAATRPYALSIFRRAGGDTPITLVLRGTNFQVKVWEALLRISEGSLTTYKELAAQIGKPRAARAVGNAVGQNPLAYVIPCHRVIRKIGVAGDYHWGAARKKAMLAWEAAEAGREDARN